MTVFVYINTAKQLGDVDYVKDFANVEAAERWFEEHASRSNMTFWSEPPRRRGRQGKRAQSPRHCEGISAAIV